MGEKELQDKSRMAGDCKVMKFEPRYYQRDAVAALFNYFENDDCGHPLIELPTAAGKSLVQAMIAEKIIKDYPDCRILFLTHQQELIKQNFNELLSNLGMVDAGIYSAGLNCRDTDNKIIFAGIQSVYKRALELGCFNLIVVDESHLIPVKAMGTYRKFLDDMLKQAPYCKIIGLTATPYRLDSGLLTTGKDKIFDEVIYRVSVAKLIKEGYLCELIGKAGAVRPDTSGVHKRGGDYIESELNKACDDTVIIKKAVTEFLQLTEGRNHVLIFCVGIEHAEHVKEEMESQGAECEVVHSKLQKHEKEKTIEGFKNGNIRYLLNVDMLTTGFNARHIDCIIMLRPTLSTGLYYQMAGRGLRTHENKKNCLILDYAGNILTHGPIDKIEVIDKGTSDGMGVKTAPMKECPKCGTPVPIQTIKCIECGYEWPVNLSHGDTAGEGEPISKYQPPMEIELSPSDTNYYVHEKNGNFSMRVCYTTGVLQSVSEWICIEHGGFAEQKAREWLRNALPAGYPIPDNVEECMELTDVYKKPELIYVDFNSRFPRIISRIYPEKEEEPEEQPEPIYKNFVR
jgi:DNA repair protein RadD